VLGGLAQPSATRKQLHHQATQAGLRVSVQGFDQRFNETAMHFMRALLQEGLSQVVRREADAVMLPQFNGVYLTDCTRLVWGDRGEKLALRWELQHGQLQACLTDLNQHDQRAEVVERRLPSGALHLGDLGFFKLERFQRWNREGVYWLTRYKLGTHLTSAEGGSIDLRAVLTGDAPVALAVKMGKTASVSAFLLAAPLTDEAFSKRQTQLKNEVRRGKRTLSAAQSALTHWTIYLTNVPDLSFAQAATLARTRWQIELLFKLWKSHGQVLRSRSADPIRQCCEGYAKLLGLVIAHWSLLVAGWQHDRLSALDALRILRTHLPLLQRAFTYFALFLDVFHWLSLDLHAAPPLSKRRKTPLAFQLWRDFDASTP
jgi:hypothetical protein